MRPSPISPGAMSMRKEKQSSSDVAVAPCDEGTINIIRIICEFTS